MPGWRDGLKGDLIPWLLEDDAAQQVGYFAGNQGLKGGLSGVASYSLSFT